MKRSLVITLALVMIVGVTAGAGMYEGPPPVKEEAWDNLPEAWKFNFTTFGQFGAQRRSEAEFQIAGYIFTKKSAKNFYEDDWPEPKDWVDSVLNRFSQPLHIYVYSYGNSSDPFDPSKFTFSQDQDSTEYSVDPEAGIAGFESDDEIMVGFVDVPNEINAKEGFFIHYEYDNTQVFAPAFTWDSPYPEEEEKTQETKGTEASEESGYDIQEHNYDFEDQDYEDYDRSWRLGYPWVEIANEKLAVSASGGHPSWSIHPRELSEDTRIDVKTEGEVLDGDGSFGIVIGYQENGDVSFYSFLINPTRNKYWISRLIEGDWRKKDTGKAGWAITEGSNQLRVEVSSNNDISFYVNSNLVKKLWGESSYNGGKVGLYVQSSSEERVVTGFEYLRLRTFE